MSARAVAAFSDSTVPGLHRLRLRVRHTVNLVSTGERIGERPSDWWRFDVEKREVQWTPFLPFAPFGPLDDSSLLYLTAHEASHGKWSGTYDVSKDDVPDAQFERFHRFVNAIEDVRVDRLSAREYGGFAAARDVLRGAFRREYLMGCPEGWAVVDTIAANAIHSFEVGLEPFGAPEAVELATQLWPRLDRIANLPSTQAVADALVPIWQALQPPEQDEEGGDGEPQPGQGGPSSEAEGGADGEAGLELEVEGVAAAAAEPDEQDEPDEPDEQEDEDGEDAGADAGADEGEDADDDAGADAGDDDGLEDEAELDEYGPSEPSDAPVRSHGSSPEPLSPGGELPGMSQDALTEQARRALERMARQREAQQEHAGKAHDLKQNGMVIEPAWHDPAWYDDRRDSIRPHLQALANRLKAVLRHNAADNWQSGQRRGRLDTARAWKAAQGSQHVFRKRKAMGGLDYTFGLLVDVSGSMQASGEQVPTAEATVLVAEAIEKAGLNVFVVPWAESVYHVKPVHESMAKHAGPLGYALRANGASTYEAPALAQALEQFSKVPATSKRMLLTITDGQTHNVDESKALIDELKMMGVQTVTLRLGGPPAAHYERGIEVEHASQLASILPRLINAVVHRGA